MENYIVDLPVKIKIKIKSDSKEEALEKVKEKYFSNSRILESHIADGSVWIMVDVSREGNSFQNADAYKSLGPIYFGNPENFKNSENSEKRVVVGTFMR